MTGQPAVVEPDPGRTYSLAEVLQMSGMPVDAGCRHVSRSYRLAVRVNAVGLSEASRFHLSPLRYPPSVLR